MMNNKLDATFVAHAASVLGATDGGLSGSEIIERTGAYAVEYDVSLPYRDYPFEAPNKRTALKENLVAFNAEQQFRIIKELCDAIHYNSSQHAAAKELKVRLHLKYPDLNVETPEAVNPRLVEETRHWLSDFPRALKPFNEALAKYEAGMFQRNVLDDLRLSLELAVQEILQNSKSLEKQEPLLGKYLKERGVSKEFRNMFLKLLDYYRRYQNNYVKHDDAVHDEEVEFVLEITSSFLKHLVRLSQRAGVPL